MLEQASTEKQKDNEKPKIGWLDVFKSTMMSFLGVQKEEMRQRDFEYGNPIHFIIMGILMATVFVLVLITIVKIILYSAGVQ